MKYIKNAALLCLMACTAQTLAASAEPAAPAPAVSKADIPSQSLIRALGAFTDQTGLQLIYVSELVEGRQSKGAPAGLSAAATLTRLLDGTNLTFEFLNERTVAIRSSKPSAGNRPKDAAVLDASAPEAMLLLAQADGDETPDAASKKKQVKTKRAGDGVEEMIVEEGRVKKPFSDANLDIPRTINDVQPYYIFDSETIERSAALNVEDFLKQRLTMNSTVLSNSQNVLGLSGSNMSQINLRGLGADKTLILVNGRRVAGSAGGSQIGVGLNNLSQPDLNGYPLSAIERIEVLPSSSSGIYGGGALAGVINVVLKKDYNGAEVRAFYDNTWNTDAATRTYSANYGTGFNEGNTRLMVTAQWSDATALLQQDRREMIDRGLSTILRNNSAFIYTNTNPFLGSLPNITSTSERINNVTIPDPGTLTLKNGTPLGSRFTHVSAGISPNTPLSTLNAELLRNAGVWNLDLPPVNDSPTGLLRPMGVTPTVKSLRFSLSQQLGSRSRLTLDWSHNVNDSVYQYPPQGYANSMTLASNNPVNPFNSAVTIRYPMVFQRPSITNATTDTLNLGLSLTLPHSWTAQFDYMWSENRSEHPWTAMDSTAYNNDVRAGNINPFVNTLIYPFALDKYVYPAGYDTYGNTQDIAIRGSGPFVSLPWGTPNLTVGLDHRIAKVPGGEFSRTFPITTTSSYRRVFFSREQAIDSAYAEMLIPLLKQAWLPMFYSLELQLSGRTERYAVDAGTPHYEVNPTTGVVTYSAPTLDGQPYFTKSSYASRNSTMGFKYQPLKDIVMRASWATAFIPPTPEQLIKNPLPDTYRTDILDPKNNGAQFSINTISGGNPSLAPQNSKSFNAGVIWEPSAAALKGLRFNAEYYRIEQFDAISSISAQSIIDNEPNYLDRIVRNSLGRITFVDTSLVNLYHRETEGWDLSLDYVWKTNFGVFNARAAESIIMHLKDQYSLTLPEYDNVNFPSEGGAGKYKSNLQLMWDRGNWTAGWSARYFSAYKQYGALGGRSATQARATNPNAALSTAYILPQGADTIPSQMYHDLSLGYNFGRKVSNGGTISALGAGIFSDVSLQLGVKNVFNKLPPYDVYYGFYTSPYGERRLRSYWLSLKKVF